MRRVKTLSICALFALLFAPISTNCGAMESPLDNPCVIVSIPPYIEIVKAIAKDSVRVESIIPTGYNPHTFEATPRQMEMLQRADLWIGIGEPYEQKLLTALETAKKKPLAIQIDEEFFPTARALSGAPDHSSHREAQDRHFWLSPQRLKRQAILIAEGICALQPHRKKEYEKNLYSYLKRTEEVDREIGRLLQPYNEKAILVSHAALEYFCRDYNLTQIAIEWEGKDPLPQTVDAILTRTPHADIQCIFAFSGHQNKGAHLIAQRLNRTVCHIDLLSDTPLITIKQIATDIADAS